MIPKDEDRCRAMARDVDGPTNERCWLPLGHESEYHRDSNGLFRTGLVSTSAKNTEVT